MMCPAPLHEKKNFPIIKEKEQEVWLAVLRKIEKHFFERFFMIFRDFEKTDWKYPNGYLQ